MHKYLFECGELAVDSDRFPASNGGVINAIDTNLLILLGRRSGLRFRLGVLNYRCGRNHTYGENQGHAPQTSWYLHHSVSTDHDSEISEIEHSALFSLLYASREKNVSLR
jgi:hypothetical protein